MSKLIKFSSQAVLEESVLQLLNNVKNDGIQSF